MDEFEHLQQVLARHQIPFHTRDRRPTLGPLVRITHGGVAILMCFDHTGAYTHLSVAEQQEAADKHETPV